jgi:tetratricopeptide (TPR) repeat protein
MFYKAQKYEEAEEWFSAARGRGGDAAIEATHWLCRILLMQGQPAEAEQLAAATLPQAGLANPFADDLQLDHADALYDQPEKRSQALAEYLKIASQADSPLAPQALYNATFAALETQQYEQGIQYAQQFAERYPEDALAADTRFIGVECRLQNRDHKGARQELTKLIADFPERPEALAWRVRLGLVLYADGQYSAAIEYLEPLIEQLENAEQLAEAQFVVGACYFFQDQFDAAAAALESSLQSSHTWRQAADATLYLARCRHKQERLDDAIELVKKLVDENSIYANSPILDQAHYRLGEFEYAAGRFPAALAAYEKVIASWPASAYAPYALYGRGWSHLKMSAFPAAIAAFSELLEDFPNHELNDDGLLARAMARREAGMYVEAIADFDAYLKTNPPDPQKSDALYERGLAQVAVGQLEPAVSTFSAILSGNPNYANADKVLYELAWAYRALKQDEQALAEFSRLVQEHADSPLAAEAFFHLGEDQYRQEQYTEAIISYTAAKDGAQLDELKEKAQYKLCWSLFQLKKFEEAASGFQELARLFPDGLLFADVLFMQGECAFKLERYGPALESFTSARGLEPSSPQMQMLTLLHGGQSAAQLKQWPLSVELLDELIERYPESPYLVEAHYERGWARQNQDQLEEALADYEIAAGEQSVVGARARFMMGEVRFTQKNFEEAIREFQRVMFLYGGDDAPAEIKNWQAKAAFEAGRCAEVQVNSSEDAQAKAAAIAEAEKFYTFITTKHPESEFAAEAKKRLAALAKL